MVKMMMMVPQDLFFRQPQVYDPPNHPERRGFSSDAVFVSSLQRLGMSCLHDHHPLDLPSSHPPDEESVLPREHRTALFAHFSPLRERERDLKGERRKSLVKASLRQLWGAERERERENERIGERTG